MPTSLGCAADGASASEASAGEASASEASAREASAGEASACEASAGEASAGEASAGEASAGVHASALAMRGTRRIQMELHAHGYVGRGIVATLLSSQDAFSRCEGTYKTRGLAGSSPR